jgi:hypothetical protein
VNIVNLMDLLRRSMRCSIRRKAPKGQMLA